MNKLDIDYQNLLKDILENGINKNDRTGTGTLSVFGRQIRHNMKDGFPLLTTKKMAWKTMITELLWFLRGDTNIKFLVDNGCHIWDGDAYKAFHNKFPETEMMSKEDFIETIRVNDEFAAKYGNLGPIYGKQWRSWGGVVRVGVEFDTETYVPTKFANERVYDQIANLINELKTNPDSRRLMVSAWNVQDISAMTLPPCHYGFQMYTRELSLKERMLIAETNTEIIPVFDSHFDIDEDVHNVLDTWNTPTRAISLMWNQRSVDTALGLPMNIASYALLLLMIANEVNMVPDQLIGNLGDVHLYSDHLEGAKEQITRTPYELPKVNINTEWWDKPFFEAVKSDNFCKCLLEEDIQLYNYQSHPKIYFPLSN
jgi:thymidylate synthase